MPTVLVTGAGGFIGSHVVERLIADGNDVRALVSYRGDGSVGWLQKHWRAEVVAGDIRDPNRMMRLLTGCDAVIHLAALIGIPHSYASPDDYIAVNVQGTLNVLQAARANGAHVVHASTSEVYGTAVTTPMTESHRLHPQSPYAATKAAADHLAESFRCSFGMRIATIRPFNTYGPRQSARAVVMNVMLQAGNGASEIAVGTRTARRDMTFVSDTVDAIVRASASRMDGVAHLGTGFAPSVSEIVAAVGKAIGRDLRTVVRSDYVRPVMSEVQHLESDPRHAMSILDWAPSVQFQDGINRTWEWFCDEENANRYPYVKGPVL